ncbi:hypothetical protein [Mucisphaera sp.]|uniref:hypothetical protein n=1 Tax=Mucisphaera sp. TaxID=2913024 RepID=UPI003D1390A3
MSYRVRVEGVSWVEAMPLLKLARAWGVALRLEAWSVAYLGLGLHLLGVALIAMLMGDRDRLWATQGVLDLLGQMLLPIGLFQGSVVAWVLWAFQVYLLKAVFGGVLCRIAAQRWAQLTSQGMVPAFRVVLRRFGWYTLTPALPVFVGVCLLIPLVVAGLLLRLPVFDWLGMALAGPGLLLGLLAVVVLVGLAVAGMLFYPSLAVEGTDGYDALSRIYSFAVGRPLSYLGALVLLVFFGLAGGALLVGVVGGAVVGGVWLLSLVSGLRMDLLWTGVAASSAAEAVWWWVLLMVLLIPAAVVAYVYAGLTLIYLTLRQLFDGTPASEVAEVDEPGTGPAAGS